MQRHNRNSKPKSPRKQVGSNVQHDVNSFTPLQKYSVGTEDVSPIDHNVVDDVNNILPAPLSNDQ